MSEFGKLLRKGVGQLGDGTARPSEKPNLCWREALRLSGNKPSFAPTDVLPGFLQVGSGKRRKELQFTEHIQCVRVCQLLPILDVISFFQKLFLKKYFLNILAPSADCKSTELTVFVLFSFSALEDPLTFQGIHVLCAEYWKQLYFCFISISVQLHLL